MNIFTGHLMAYDGISFSSISTHDIFLNRRVLVCSATRLSSICFQRYANTLALKAELYKNFGIDQVYLITHGEKFALSAMNLHAPTLVGLYDIDDTFITTLSNYYRYTKLPVTDLANKWNYQVLINNGQIEKLYDQPILLKDLLRGNKKTANNIFNHMVRIQIESNLYSPTFLRKELLMSRDIYYSNIHPNIDLINHLFQC